ncbi:MAG: HNH/ENDO VII family nuclease [Lachnospiraceae bacterium]|nr:HNH/ENDO VII family nuclease [Lachnospiraceae bacterium]
MKRIISVILACSLFLNACAVSTDNTNQISTNQVEFSDTEFETDNSSVISDTKLSATDTGDNANEDTISDSGVDGELGFTVKGLDDETLINYVEDNIYAGLVDQLNSEEFFVENVEAIYYPKEYIEALASNSQPNLYFGYTSDELNEQFQGTKYVFTLGDDGQTVVVPMETLTDDVYVKAMEDVIIGTGVILVCVTVSVVTAQALPAVSMIFAASASTGTAFAKGSGAIGFASAAITKGYETESFEQAIKAGVEASGEGFKWGAICGVVYGGGKEAITLKGATLNGLKMNDAARIQKESGFPLELIKQFKSYNEYEVYKNAGLYTKMVNGKLALVRDIDLNYITELSDGTKVTNLELMRDGKAPFDPATGKRYQLHHINQEVDGTLAILKEAEHQGNASILNKAGKPGVQNPETGDKLWPKKREAFWKAYAAMVG